MCVRARVPVRQTWKKLCSHLSRPFFKTLQRYSHRSPLTYGLLLLAACGAAAAADPGSAPLPREDYGSAVQCGAAEVFSAGRIKAGNRPLVFESLHFLQIFVLFAKCLSAMVLRSGTLTFISPAGALSVSPLASRRHGGFALTR